MARPVWALSTKDLRKWQKLQGIVLFAGQNAQVLFVDYEEPIGVMLLRPLALSKEGRIIRGTFGLEEEKARRWVCGRYDGIVCGFVVSATAEMLDFLNKHPEIVQFFDVDGRARVRNLLAQGERQCKAKLESTSSLQESLGWQAICSTSSPSQPPRPSPVTLPRQPSQPISRSQPALIG